jgi:hypothetical protein
MLLSFRFSNHRSFRDEQVLDLAPGPRPVPVAGIFGVNASGKSNAISALSSLKAMTLFSGIALIPSLSWQQRHPHQPFRLDPECAAGPSRYVADVLLGGVRYTYGFVLEGGSVAAEWLYSYPAQRQRVIFERTGPDISWGPESAGSEICRSADSVTPSILLLTVAMHTRARAADAAPPDETRSLMRDFSTWLTRRVSVAREAGLGGDASYQDLAASSGWRATVTGFLRAADPGLEDVAFDEQAVEESMARLRDGTGRVPDEKLRRIVLRSRRPGSGKLRFRHSGALDGEAFDQADESSGTLKFLELATYAFDALDDGGLLLVDELDASLHPLLAAEIVRLFQDPGVNQNGAQLIFTTHGATLLGSIDGQDVLRRDEVWFTRKEANGASQLFPLPEFGPRRQAERQQAVDPPEGGRHDAIRELSMRMFEQAITSRADSSAG